MERRKMEKSNKNEKKKNWIEFAFATCVSLGNLMELLLSGLKSFPEGIAQHLSWN
jgi:hypothetical protein